MIRVTFVMEQHIGHRAYYQNLRQFIDQTQEIEANWVPITYEDDGYAWTRLPFLPQGVRGTLNGRAQARSGLKQTPADVVLANTQVPAALAGRLIHRQPYILSTDITPRQYDEMAELYGHQPDRWKLLRDYKHRVNCALFRGAARVLPWSTWVEDSLIRDYGVNSERIEVVPPGVNLDIWRPKARQPNGTLRILFVGGDFYRKGGDVLRDAFRQLPDGLAELVLVTRSQIQPQRGVLVYNHLQPNSAELIDLYQTADVFVLPTKAEAFGIAAIEASAMGMPVIATAVGGVTDIVVDGENGFLVSPGNVDLLAKRLHQLAADPDLRKRLGQAARSRAEQKFDARQNAARITEILHQTAV